MRQIKTTGTGKVTARPSAMMLNVSTETISETAVQTRKFHTAKSQDVNQVILNHGVNGKDITHSRFNYGQNIVFNRETNQTERHGFKASSTFSFRVRDFDAVPDLLDQLTAAGATSIDGPNFEVDNRTDMFDLARVAAYHDALRKVEVVGEAAGFRVLDLIEAEIQGEGISGGGKGSNVRQRGDDEHATLLGEVEMTAIIECTFEIATAG